MDISTAIRILEAGSKIPDFQHTGDDLDKACAMACSALRAQQHRESGVYEQAIETFGPQAQTVMVFEEMAELQKELCKNARGEQNRAEIADEIADVEIMLEQMKVLHKCAAEVEQHWAQKLERLQKRIRKKQQQNQEGFELMVVTRCKDCCHYGEIGDCDIHPHDGRFNREYFCADAERRQDTEHS